MSVEKQKMTSELKVDNDVVSQPTQKIRFREKQFIKNDKLKLLISKPT